MSIRQVTESFLSAKSNPETLKTWVNTSLGETWEEGGETVDPAAIETRGEIYDYATLPDGIVALAAGVDVHDDRIEMQVIGWGHKEEAWACRYEVIHGDPSQAKVWDELDALLLEQGKTEAGRLLRIRAACVDVGGHHGERVLAFCRPRRARRVFAVKGRAGPWPVWPKRATRSKTNDQIFLVGVDTAKDAIYGRLKIVSPGPSYVHFPAEEGFDKAYFKQLTSERVQTRYKEASNGFFPLSVIGIGTSNCSGSLEWGYIAVPRTGTRSGTDSPLSRRRSHSSNWGLQAARRGTSSRFRRR